MTATAHPRTVHARVFHALSDETRLRILDVLRRGERCVCELTGSLDAAQSRLSFHLRTLKDAGLVADRRDGRWVYYTLRPEALAEARDLLVGLEEGAVIGPAEPENGCCT